MIRTPQHALPSEDALALTFAAQYGDRLRYCAKTRTTGDWFVRSDDSSIRADSLLVVELTREVCRAAAAQHVPPGLASAATISAVQRLARSDRRLAALPTDLGLPKKRTAKRARRASSKGRAQS